MDEELECSALVIRIHSPLGIQQVIAGTASMAHGLKEGWSMMTGIMTVSMKLLFHDTIILHLYGTHPTMNVFYKNISITPIPTTCQNQVLNGGFEVGDTRLWRYNSRFIDVDIVDFGAEGSQYSAMIQARNSAYRGMSQDLDVRCLVVGQELLISAKFQLLNATDMATGIECDPSLLTVSRPTHCPTVTIRGTDCEEGDFELLFFNDIDHFQWDANNFNDFQKAFSITTQIASCDVSFLVLLYNLFFLILSLSLNIFCNF